MSEIANSLYTYEDLQKLVIKSLIHQPLMVSEVTKEVTSEDFSNIKYKAIFSLLIDLSSASIRPDVSLVYKELQEKYNINLTSEDIELFTSPPLEPPVILSKLLKRESVVDDTKKHLSNSLDGLNKESWNIEEILGKIHTKTEELGERLLEKEEKTFKDSVKESTETILLDEEDLKYVIPTPYNGLNKYLLNGGFEPNQLITIGARTGVGKTVLATNITEFTCSMGKSVLYFSLEVNEDKLIKRFLASHGNVMLSHLRPQKGRHENVIKRIKEASESIANWKLKIIDETDVTIEKIKSYANAMAKSKDGLDMIVIDYLQLMSTAGIIAGNRQEQVAQISRQCKNLAKNYGIPVIILVQLNREQKGDDEERIPSKADIRESAAIAADSDIVLIIHRKYRDESTDPKALLILDKNRDGASDKKITLRCALEKNIFQDISDKENEGNEEVKEIVEEAKNEAKENNIVPNDFGEVQDIATDWDFMDEIDEENEDEEFGDLFGDES